MKIMLTNYTPEGELLAISDSDLNYKRPGIGGTPTTDPGYYHRFMFQSTTKAETIDKARRFFALMETVPGYSTLRLEEYEVNVFGVHYGYDIVYVVENPGIR